MTKAELIRKHAEILRGLHEYIHEAAKARGKGDTERKRWEDACRNFHESYDGLAFPGGLNQWLTRLKIHDSAAIEDAVLFLEVDPVFFRSGYIKESVLEQLRWAPLTTEEKKRLQQVIVARIRDLRTKREFRRYACLAPFVSDTEFEQAISKLAGPSGAKPKRAQWVLEHLRQGVPKGKQ